MELGSATAGVVDPRSTRLWLVGGKVVGTDQGQTLIQVKLMQLTQHQDLD
jgi:hypothetical protein